MNFDSSHATGDGEDFASLFEASMDGSEPFTGKVVKGRVIKIGDDFALVDVGLKSEGKISLREFTQGVGATEVKVGDEVDLFVERYEDRDGTIILSREKARREETWSILARASENHENVTGKIVGRVKGGYTVDLDGTPAFLPNSQVDIRPTRDTGSLIGVQQLFQLVKMDRARGNIVVSRRAVMEEARSGQKAEVLKNLREGAVFEGVVKNMTDYGAFVDLGGVDGLLHVTDIAWHRVNHPSEVLAVGDQVRVQVIRFNAENQRISLGMKQFGPDPWDGVKAKYAVGSLFSGRVTNVTDYGAFVELESGIDGLVHVSEMSWHKAAVHPGKLVSTSQQVDVVVLEVDEAKRRISLGMKQANGNPWELFRKENPVGSIIDGDVHSSTEFGLFVAIGPELDGMVHISDISWDEPNAQTLASFSAGDAIKVKVLEIDVIEQRISLGIKQLAPDPAAASLDRVRKGEIVTCTVVKIEQNGIEVRVDDILTGFIRRAELARDREDQKPDRFSVGELVDARVTAVDRPARRLTLTIRGKEVEEDRQAMEKYGSSDSGASLGDILAAAIRRRNQSSD